MVLIFSCHKELDSHFGVISKTMMKIINDWDILKMIIMIGGLWSQVQARISQWSTNREITFKEKERN